MYVPELLPTKRERDEVAYSIERYIREGWVVLSLIGTYNISVNAEGPTPRGRLAGVRSGADWLLWLARRGKQLDDARHAVIFSLEAFFWEEHYREHGLEDPWHGQERKG